ncbi:hypothetical protein COX64_01165 [Candidatus Dojkabacteria bacterium CG_4_10_14_0_2_um_filter_Dojkabacteria_WS6_41_15]|uniref:Uncharacterized protein n=1 Tax=Candidatus Dojkabacteria bacterium CG_4_10_14_0_2_um_filter_Dojkabacteria_WS6_41_15 TaxID=2014249 RepID=A0A2M7W2R8_9BACT|nr:MAG: hypothetical protein COX64_01165 [Candidatus Dojkabacteria bacterium CG_4_10_14_0_2_um_filter_Dojkabacteria_WS6_41_15]
MAKNTNKKVILSVIALIAIIGFRVALADGQGTPSPYHNPTDTGINLDTTLVLGAGMYGAGILMTSAARAIQTKPNHR